MAQNTDFYALDDKFSPSANDRNEIGPSKSDLIFLADAEAKRAAIFNSRNGKRLVAYFHALVHIRLHSRLSTYRSVCVNLLIAELKPFIENDSQTEMLIFKDAALKACSELDQLLTQEMDEEDEAALTLIEQRIYTVAESVLKLQSYSGEGASHATMSVESAYKIDGNKNPNRLNTPNSEQSKAFGHRSATRIPTIILQSRRMAAYFQNQVIASLENGRNRSTSSGDMIDQIPTIIAPTPASSPISPQQNPSFSLTRPDTPTTRSHYRTSSTWNGTIGLRRTVSSIITPGFDVDADRKAEISHNEDTTKRLHPFYATQTPSLRYESDIAVLHPNCAKAVSGLSRRISFENDIPSVRSAWGLSASNRSTNHVSMSLRDMDEPLADNWGWLTPKRSSGSLGFHDSIIGFNGETGGMMLQLSSQTGMSLSHPYPMQERLNDKSN